MTHADYATLRNISFSIIQILFQCKQMLVRRLLSDLPNKKAPDKDASEAAYLSSSEGLTVLSPHITLKYKWAPSSL